MELNLLLKIIEVTNWILGSIVSSVILWQFFRNKNTIKVIFNNALAPKYLESYEKIHRILKRKMNNSKIEHEDIDELKDAKRVADLYLDKEIQNLIQALIDCFAEIFVIENSDDKTGIKEELIKLKKYRNNLENIYRPYLTDNKEVLNNARR